MSITNELPEMILGSRVQSEEEIQKVLSDLGYEGVETDVVSDASPEPEVKTEADTSSSVPSTEAGGDAGEVEGETPEGDEAASETALTPAQEQTPAGDKPKGGYKKRISKLQSENEALKRQLAERSAEKPAEAIAPKAEEPPVEIPEERAQPTLEDVDADGNPKYKDYDEVILALFDWRKEASERERLLAAQTARETKAAEEAQAQAKAELEQATARWNEQVEIGRSNHADFDTVYEEAGKLPAAVPLTTAIQDSELNGELVYYLGTHRDELERLNKLLEVPQNAPQAEFRRKLKLAYREIDRLEQVVSSAVHTDEEEADPHAAAGPEETPATDAARESRVAAPKPAAIPAAAAPVPVKPKPEPIRPVGSRGTTTRKRLNDMTRDEIHALSPDDLRKMVETA